MKGRVDRPGQTRSELKLVIVFAQATIEEAEFANIRLAGSFFRTYLAPKATKYKEALLQVDLAAMVAVHGGGENRGAKRPKAGAVRDAWHTALEERTDANALQGHVGSDPPAMGGGAGSSRDAMAVDGEEAEAGQEEEDAVDPPGKRARGGVGGVGGVGGAGAGAGK